MLYIGVVLTFKSVDEILKCDHSNESCRALLSCGAVYYTMQVGSNFENVGENFTTIRRFSKRFCAFNTHL